MRSAKEQSIEVEGRVQTVLPGTMFRVELSRDPHAGRGGWSWYTGSAGWMYQLLGETLLDFNRLGDQLRLTPRLPKSRPTCTVRYRYKHTTYPVRISRLPDGSAGEAFPGEPITSISGQLKDQAGPHLRSTQVVKRYAIGTCDGAKGHLCDFLLDGENWAIRQLVVKTGRKFSGQELEIPARQVERISEEESTVFVNLTREALEQSPQHQPALACWRAKSSPG